MVESQNSKSQTNRLSIVQYSTKEIQLKKDLIQCQCELKNEKVCSSLQPSFNTIVSITTGFSESWLKMSSDMAGYLYSIHYRSPEIKDYNDEILKIIKDSTDLSQEQIKEVKPYFEETIEIVKALREEVEILKKKRAILSDKYLTLTSEVIKKF